MKFVQKRIPFLLVVGITLGWIIVQTPSIAQPPEDVAAPCLATETQDDTVLRCSFCGISIEELELLITGPGVHICSSCVQACIQVMVSKHGYALHLSPQLGDSIASRISGHD